MLTDRRTIARSGLRGIAPACAILLASCIQSGLSICPTSGRVCGEGLFCDDALDTCVGTRTDLCGDTVLGDFEECDDGNKLSHDGCSSTCRDEVPVWRRLDANSGGPRKRMAIAYDAFRGKVVELGGSSDDDTMIYPQTREWDGTQWHILLPSPSPPRRESAALGYDPRMQRLVLFGGADANTGWFNDSWEYNGVWKQPSPLPTPPSPRYGHAMATTENTILMFGGVSENGMVIGESDETFVLMGNYWAPPSFPPITLPLARSGHGMAPFGDAVVMFGGGTFLTNSDTWVWNGTVWEEHVGPSPGYLVYYAMAYAGGKGVVMFGGIGETPTPLSDTWLWDGERWAKLEPAMSPGARSHHAMTYDAIHRYAILSGGWDGQTTLSDTWAFRFEAPSHMDESCIVGEDADQDGKAACDDPDCWGYCTPHCPPGPLPCGDRTPKCGDGTCNETLERNRCPEDCP